MPPVKIRAARPTDAEAWIRLRTGLWPAAPDDHPSEVAEYFAAPPRNSACFLAESAGEVVGFVEVGLRAYAEECRTSPVGYVEGVYVDAGARSWGVGRLLVEAGEAWARARGCSEMASDRALDDEKSGAFHQAVGYEEVHRIVCYRKELS